jgi:urease accessory protein
MATRVRATNPLKLLVPRRPGPNTWVYTSTFGGGLVAGDQLKLDVNLKPGTSCILGTQASTKVYRNPARRPCSQSIQAVIAEDATLIVSPDPITCFAEADYEQTQQFMMSARASLLLIDWLTSGRYANGERWDFSRFKSRTEIYVENQLLVQESLLLVPDEVPLDSPFRMGRFNCIATVVIMGDKLQGISQPILEKVGSKPIQPKGALIDAVSPIKSGAIWRIMGESTEAVSLYIHSELDPLKNILGETPWLRKW